MANRFLSLVLGAGLMLAGVACDSGPTAPSAVDTGRSASLGAGAPGVTAGGAGGDAAKTQLNFVGSITSVSPLVVAGRPVMIDSSTQVLDRQNNPIAIGALNAGGLVQVEGVSQSDGSILAKKIKIEDGDDHAAENEVDFFGSITSLSPLFVASRMVITDSSTRLLDGKNDPLAMGAFKAGDMVEVEGTSRSDGSVLAKKIKLEDENEREAGKQVNFVGSITGLSPLVVASRTVMTDSGTRLLDRNNNPIAIGAFKGGDMVEVEGTNRSDGSVLAKKIKLQG